MGAGGISGNDAGRVALRRLPRALARAFGPLARRYLLFEDFTLIDPDEMRRRREHWPAWRRGLRPVGATIWWLGVVLGWVLPSYNGHGNALFVLGLAITGVFVACIALGVGLEWHDRLRKGRSILRP